MNVQHLFGNKTVEKILFFLLVNEKCYATQLHHFFHVPLTPIQNALLKLEKGGLLVSSLEGKTRFFQFNPNCPYLQELETLLKRIYSLLPTHIQKTYYDTSTKCRLVKVGRPKSSTENVLSKQQVLANVWNKLSTIQSLSFCAKSKSADKSGWNGIGKGQVELKRISSQILIFNERGKWMSEEGNEFDFSNIFRWTLDQSKQLISLEHLRFGVHNPVFLFHLAPISENILDSIHSYQCEDDIYLGQIRCDTHFIQLSWRVLGPKKNEEIDYLYT